MSEEVQHAALARFFELDAVEFLTNLRKARGAAPGPSGMTFDHLFPVLESPAVLELLVQVASHLAAESLKKLRGHQVGPVDGFEQT